MDTSLEAQADREAEAIVAALKGAEDDNRLLRYRLGQANKTMGRQGQTIHELRAELAEVRELHGKVERGDVRRTERENANLVDAVKSLQEQLTAARARCGELREWLDALQQDDGEGLNDQR